MLIPNSRGRIGLCLRAVLFAILLSSVALIAQSTPGAGAIRGVVIDPKGATVSGAKVAITNKATGAMVRTESSSSGDFSSGPLQPGEYRVRVSAPGAKIAELEITVRIAVISPAEVKLLAGKETEVAKISPEETLVNTQQPTVQSVLPEGLLEILPVSGRNYLDLAQLAPGVQFLDAGILDSRKLGLATVSIQGQSGRSVRYEVDGVTINDEIAGTTTQNIPASAIREFNISRSTIDLPTELTSSGAVLVSTRSGENDLHGEIFGLFRGKSGSAALPGSASAESFSREQYGARVGGALVKDKIFWFLAAERLQQNLTAAVPFAAPFDTLGTALSRPFRDLQADGRLDWQRNDNAHAFYRFTYDQVSQMGPFGGYSSLQGLREATHTPSHTLGYDFTRGIYTHSLRFEYMRMHTGVGDDSPFIATGVNNPVPGVGVSIGAPVAGNCGLSGSGAYCAGPSPFAPQLTLQSNYQVRYDGTRVTGAHLIRFGVTYDRIQGGGFSSLFFNPQLGTTGVCLPGSISAVCLTSADPTAYPADFAFLGNGSGFSTATSAYGFPGGRLGPDNRLEGYLGDNWRLRRSLMVSYGLRYSRETGRVDHELGGVPVLNQWQPGLGNPVRSPNTDFGPQAGLAWDVNGTGKTVLRIGGGVYYDTSLWSNMMLDARARSKNGMLTYTPEVCANGNASAFTWPTAVPGGNGSAIAGGAAVVTDAAANQVAPTFCGTSISAAAAPILALSSAFQSAAASGTASQPNPNYIATALSAANANGLDVFAPDFRTPRVIQMNGGFQTEVSKGTILSIDYVRTIGTHNLLIVDQNRSGSARSYNFTNALAARDAAQLAAGCAAGLGQAPCVVNNLGSVAAAQAAYSAAGLDSNSAVTGGAPCSFCAFPGITPFGVNRTGNGGGNGSLGTLDTLSTIGRSVYWGAQIRLAQHFTNPSHGIQSADFQVAYSYSKFVSQSPDQDLATPVNNNDNPLQFTGPNGMDRKHQISFGGTFQLPWLTHLSFMGHFYSPLPATLRLPELTNGGEIFASDWTGGGLASGGLPEPVKGTGIGQFMRGADTNNVQVAISNYNTHFAGKLTPAGNCLVAASNCLGAAPIPVMTTSDMSTLGWVLPTLPSLAPDAMGFPWLKTFDLRASWPIKVGDRVTVEPSASAYNIFNFANSFLPGNLAGSSLYPGPNPTLAPNGILSPSVAGGITGATLTPFRAGLQSGSFALGSPRQLEFGLKITF